MTVEEKITEAQTQFATFTHLLPVFDIILSIEVLKRIFDDKLWSVMVTYKFCMIPKLSHSFLVILALSRTLLASKRSFRGWIKILRAF